MKYTSKKGTVINIPDNLGPKQVAKIKADADAGYGTRAQKTAKQLSKKVAGKNPTPVTTPTTPAVDPNAGIDPETGAIDPEAALNAAYAHWNDERAQGLRAKAQDAAYAFSTQNLERDKARALEAAQQEMANRGIPYRPDEALNPNTTDLYGKTIGGVTQHFEALDKQAKDQALLQGNQIYETETTANRANFDSFMQAILNMSDADLRKYGIDKNYALGKAGLKSGEKIAKMNNKPSGAAPSSGGGDSGGGFEIL